MLDTWIYINVINKIWFMVFMSLSAIAFLALLGYYYPETTNANKNKKPENS